jgi:hypothetical protein
LLKLINNINKTITSKEYSFEFLTNFSTSNDFNDILLAIFNNKNIEIEQLIIRNCLFNAIFNNFKGYDILSQHYENKEEIFFKAIQHDNINAVTYIVEELNYNPDVNLSLIKSSRTSSLNSIKYLIEVLEADPSLSNNEPFSYAVINQNEKVLKYLFSFSSVRKLLFQNNLKTYEFYYNNFLDLMIKEKISKF